MTAATPYWALSIRDAYLISSFAPASADRVHQLGDAESIIAAGIAVVAADTGRVLLIQRSLSEDVAPGRWEFPGGKLEGDERPIDAAAREWKEETGMLLPSSGRFVDGWYSPDRVYAGYVFRIEAEDDLEINPDFENRQVTNPDDPTGDEVETQAWFFIDDLARMPQLREEVRATPWPKILAALPDPEPLLLATQFPLEADPDGDFAPRNVSPDSRRRWAKQGIALPDGSYPIPNKDFLRRAIMAYGRAPAAKRAAVRRHIIKRARALGATDMIPDSWKQANAMANTPINLDLTDVVASALAASNLLVDLAPASEAPAPDTVELTDEDFTWEALLLIEGVPTGDGCFF